MKSFSIGEAISFGWQAIKKQPIIILYTFAALFGVQIVQAILSGVLENIDNSLLTLMFSLVFFLASLVLSIGLIRVYLNAYAGKKLEIPHLYQDYKLVFWYLLASLLNGLIVIVGLILLIIPGIIFGVRLSLWPYIMVEGERSSVNALKKSWNMTKGNSLNLFLLYVVEGFVVVLGVLALLLGLFVAIPVAYMATVYAYKKLAAK